MVSTWPVWNLFLWCRYGVAWVEVAVFPATRDDLENVSTVVDAGGVGFTTE